MRTLATLTLKELRTDKEETLFALLLFFAVSPWLLIVISIIGLLYVGLVAFILMVGQHLFLAMVRGNGVRLSPTQLPEIHARVVEARQRVGVARVPEAYVLQAGGLLNAFATKIFSRNFIIIFSDLIDACGDDAAALDFVIGHEMGHLALGHLKWQVWLAPGRLTPLIGQAYSRACEYSCDRTGLVVAGSLEAACHGIAVLAAGGKLARQVSLDAFAEQATDTQDFWAGIYELSTTHPYLPKRLRALREFMVPGTAPALGRTWLAYPFAPLFGAGLSAAGSTTAAIMVIYFAAVAGIMAAVAIPAFQRYAASAKQSEARRLVETCGNAQRTYFGEHKKYGTSFADIGLAIDPPPTIYGLAMGDAHLGPLPPGAPPGYVEEVGFSCVASANLDDDDTLDVWYADAEQPIAQHYVDDVTDKVLEEEATDVPDVPAPQEIAPAAPNHDD